MVPAYNEGAAKGLRIINFIVPWVLKSNFFKPDVLAASWQVPGL